MERHNESNYSAENDLHHLSMILTSTMNQNIIEISKKFNRHTCAWRNFIDGIFDFSVDSPSYSILLFFKNYFSTIFCSSTAFLLITCWNYCFSLFMFQILLFVLHGNIKLRKNIYFFHQVRQADQTIIQIIHIIFISRNFY